jgi:hypothetical protein
LNPHGREPGGFSYPLQLSLPSPLARFTAREPSFNVRPKASTLRTRRKGRELVSLFLKLP